MIFFLFLSFFLCVVSKKFTTKVLNTPIYTFIPFSGFHKIILFKEGSFENQSNEFNDIFAIDFCPSGNIRSPIYIKKLLSGKPVQGKIRVFRFDKIKRRELIRELFLDKFKDENLEILEDIDPHLGTIIKYWNTDFKLYTHNCRDFSRYLLKNY